ncbi:MAG TPA: nucleotidyl transferase AbiEii/AbiGii toxin family protein [Longimicrobiales bacterium]
MALHAEVMPVTQQRMLRRLGAFATERGFYLGGGTAIAIQLGHRRSDDLDWFTPGEIAEPLGLSSELRRSGFSFEVTGVEEGTLHGEVESVKLSFLEYRYPALIPPVEWTECGCRLAALEDLACMKLSAIGDRGAKKDFIDIYALGRTRFTLEQMLEFYQQKFDTRDIAHAIMALIYFDDAEEEEMPEMVWDVGWPEVKRAIEGWVRDYIRRQAPPQRGGRGPLP